MTAPSPTNEPRKLTRFRLGILSHGSETVRANALAAPLYVLPSLVVPAVPLVVTRAQAEALRQIEEASAAT